MWPSSDGRCCSTVVSLSRRVGRGEGRWSFQRELRILGLPSTVSRLLYSVDGCAYFVIVDQSISNNHGRYQKPVNLAHNSRLKRGVDSMSMFPTIAIAISWPSALTLAASSRSADTSGAVVADFSWSSACGKVISGMRDCWDGLGVETQSEQRTFRPAP